MARRIVVETLADAARHHPDRAVATAARAELRRRIFAEWRALNRRVKEYAADLHACTRDIGLSAQQMEAFAEALHTTGEGAAHGT